MVPKCSYLWFWCKKFWTNNVSKTLYRSVLSLIAKGGMHMWSLDTCVSAIQMCHHYTWCLSTCHPHLPLLKCVPFYFHSGMCTGGRPLHCWRRLHICVLPTHSLGICTHKSPASPLLICGLSYFNTEVYIDAFAGFGAFILSWEHYTFPFPFSPSPSAVLSNKTCFDFTAFSWNSFLWDKAMNLKGLGKVWDWLCFWCQLGVCPWVTHMKWEGERQQPQKPQKGLSFFLLSTSTIQESG